MRLLAALAPLHCPFQLIVLSNSLANITNTEASNALTATIEVKKMYDVLIRLK